MSFSIEKQLLINEISNQYNICNEVTDIIKSYAFYDTTTYNTIQLKKEIADIIKNEIIFYQCKYKQNNVYTHWGVLFKNELPMIKMCNDMCKKCGNYCVFYFDNKNGHIPKNGLCKCI